MPAAPSLRWQGGACLAVNFTLEPRERFPANNAATPNKPSFSSSFLLRPLPTFPDQQLLSQRSQVSDRLPNGPPPTEEPSRVTGDGDRVANRNRSSRLTTYTNTSLGRGEIHALPGTDDGSEIGREGAVGARAQGDKVVNKVVSNLPDHPQIFTLSRR